MIVVCAGYYAGARLGLALCDPVDRITLVWPATGVAVAALLRFGPGCWPGIFLAVVLVERAAGHPWGGSFSIACTNTLGPLIAVQILKRLRFDSDFSHGSDGPALALAAVVGMGVTASGGALSLVLTGQIPWAAFAPAWLRWWLGDSGGVLLLAPLLLSFKRANLNPILTQIPEFSALCAALGFFGWFAFLRESESIDLGYAHAFVMLPLVAWGALRFGNVGAGFSSLAVAVFAATGSALGRGQFHLPGAQQGTLLLWSFIVASCLLGLMITAVQTQRLWSEKRLRASIENAPNVAVRWCDSEGGGAVLESDGGKALRLDVG